MAKKINEYTKIKIIKAHRYLGLTYDEIARAYDVSFYAVQKICREANKTW